MHTDVLIIGGGLSGLHTAHECKKRGIDYMLLEARDRLGGRVFSKNIVSSAYDPRLAGIDLGPSWFWPGQRLMHALIAELDIENDIFFQYGKGDAVYEDNQGNIQRGIDGVTMSGACRLKGGISQIISALTDKLSRENIICGAAVSAIKYSQQEIIATYEINNISKQISSKRVVIALPPRVALVEIIFDPVFSEGRKHQINEVATWMAGHAKLVSIYEKPFWREQGFSGDVISHQGPLQEIHDASSEDGSLNALFGFLGIQAVHRKNRENELKKMAIAQLVRIFGKQALNPKIIYMQDWAKERYTSTSLDQEIQRFHPANNMVNVRETSWDNNLIWSGSEAADYSQQNNGFLEGALEASMHTVSLIE